ncbi:hypothetical protein DMA15_26465 [Streptomyces sp. WAC 01529]|uniref:DUF6191 domain-containing protein n=1 Tax=Streptomyces sp. WAC 01529 TaxID=2203205 RepID=UPI000F6FD967|nr:DUF6191 domain-containing protein [Streptomyces sp. WAC 01529]AZM55691.1 hypothetical protein DMA15_26465 [Streptomyces sp. WAC 01529]
MFNAIEALFAPGRKHTDDEQKRLEMTRVDLADGDPGRGPIDLTSGKVVVRPAVRPPVPSPRGDEGSGSDEASGSDEGSGSDEAPRSRDADG